MQLQMKESPYTWIVYFNSEEQFMTFDAKIGFNRKLREKLKYEKIKIWQL